MHCEFLKGRGACHSGGLRNFRSDNTEQWQCCTTLRPADTLIQSPSAIGYGSTAAKQLPILYLPPDDIASRVSASAELLVYIDIRLS